MITPKKLQDYTEIKYQLDQYKALEAEMRLEILEDLFPTASTGTFTATLGEFRVKGAFSNRATVDKQALEDYVEQLTEEEVACIKWTPSLIVAKYKELQEDETSGLLEDCLTFKPAMPTIEVEYEDQ